MFYVITLIFIIQQCCFMCIFKKNDYKQLLFNQLIIWILLKFFFLS